MMCHLIFIPLKERFPCTGKLIFILLVKFIFNFTLLVKVIFTVILNLCFTYMKLISVQ